jgi:hypothetical protein
MIDDVLRQNWSTLHSQAYTLTCATCVGISQIEKANATAISAVAFMVAGGGFEQPIFGLCDLTHLSMRVGLYLHPRGMLAIQSLRFPRSSGFGIALIARAT